MSHFRGIDDRLEERMIKWMILWMIVRETGSITRWESTGIFFIIGFKLYNAGFWEHQAPRAADFQ